MVNSFSELKKNNRTQFKKAQEQVQKVMNPKNSQKDERFWTLTVDKSGNGSAIIRFLPAAPGETSPFVQTFSHAFQGVGGWYIENSLTTVGKPDPVAEMNSALYNDGQGDYLRENGRYRVTNYIANVYIVNDPANPDNNGKVFLYRFGKKIFGMINDAMFPAEDVDDEGNPIEVPGVDIFSFWEGANFKLQAKNKSGFRNYDFSKFYKPKPLLDDDDQLEKLWNSQHKLKPFLDPENTEQFKTYEQLKARLIRVLGDEALEHFGGSAPTADSKSAPVQENVQQKSVAEESSPEVDLDLDDDDDLDDLPFDLDDDDDDESFQSLVDDDDDLDDEIPF